MLKNSKKIQNSGENIAKLLKDQTEKLIEVFDDRIQIVQEEFKGINRKLDSHEEQIGNIIVDMSEVKIKINDINYKVTFDLDRKIDKKHFVELDTRVRRLEKKTP